MERMKTQDTENQYIVKPMVFTEAVSKISKKVPLAIWMTSEQWSNVPVQIRERAFFSARVASAKALTSFKTLIEDYLTGTVEKVVNDAGETVDRIKVGSRAEFVELATRKAADEGLGDILPDNATREERSLMERIQDPAGPTRQQLVFDTQVKQANGYGWWRAGNRPEILDTFPAQRFIRGHAVMTPRPLHAEYEGTVRRKDDIAFWSYMNNRDIGGFEVPWPPFGFNSGMDVEDVAREEAIALKLIKPDEQIKSPEMEFNEGLEADVSGVSPEILKQMEKAINIKNGVATPK